MLDASLALLLARYQQRTVLKIQGASHTRSHDRVSAKGPPWMEMEREVAFVKRKGSKRAAGPRHGLVDGAGAPLLAVEADLLRRVLSSSSPLCVRVGPTPRRVC